MGYGGVTRWITVSGTGLLAYAAFAAPFVPAADAQVLERRPLRAAAQNRELERLKAAAMTAPRDVSAATALADAHCQIARAEGDPRYLG